MDSLRDIQFDAASPDLAALLDALPQLQLDHPEPDTEWLSEWLSDTGASFSSSYVPSLHSSSFNVPPLEGTWSIRSPFRRLPTLASQVYSHLCIGRDPRHIDMAYTRSPARSSPPHPRSIPLPSSADHRSVRSPNGLSQTRVPPFLAMLPQRHASTRGRTSAPPSQIHSRSLHPHRSFSPPIPCSRRSRWRFNTKLCMSKSPSSIQSQKKN